MSHAIKVKCVKQILLKQILLKTIQLKSRNLTEKQEEREELYCPVIFVSKLIQWNKKLFFLSKKTNERIV